VKQIARRALGLCVEADRIAEQASASVGTDEERLFALLEERDAVLADLAGHIATLQLHRYTADDGLFASTERVVNDADTLVTEVCEALSASQRTTMALAMRVAERVAELRAELANVQRAGSAGLGYATLATPNRVNRIR